MDKETTQALLLIEQGRLAEAEALLQAALRSGVDRASVLYGLGVASYTRTDYGLAAQQLRESIKIDPGNANAYFYLGLTAQKQGRAEDALTMFRSAIGINPKHVSALAAMQSATSVARQPVDQTIHERRPSPGSPYGVYEFLVRDSSGLAAETVAAMDQLRTDARPRFVAHSGFILFIAFMLALSFGAAVFITEQITYNVCPFETCQFILGMPSQAWTGLAIGLALSSAVAVLGYLAIRTTHIVIDRGRLQIERGVFSRSLLNIELWRVLDVGLHQSMLNRLTGDGTLTIQFEHGPGHQPDTVELTGLARGGHLKQTHQQLLNLVFLLRSNPYVKGMIS